MANALTGQELAQQFVLLDGHRTYQHGLTLGVALLHLTDDGLILAHLRLVHAVLIVHTGDGTVGGDLHDVEIVDGAELLRLGHSRTGHAGELFIQAEIVLEGDGSQRLALALDFHTLLGLDGLMETFTVAAAEHETTCKLIDDDDLAVLHHVVHIALHDAVGADGLIDVVGDGAVLGVAQVLQMEELLGLLNAAGGEGHRLGLLIHDVVGIQLGIFLLLGVGLHDGEALQLTDEDLRHVIHLGGLIALTGDDEGGAGLVDQDGVHLVHDGEVMLALHQLVGVDGHIVAEIVKAHLVVGTVSHVGEICLLTLGLIHIVDNETHLEAEETMDFTHPLAIALGKVVVDGDDMDTFAAQCVKVGGESGHQRLTFTGLHLGDAALVQDDAADELHGVGAHAQHAVRCLADGGKCLGQNVVQRLAVLEALLKFHRLCLQLGIGESLILLLHCLDAVDDGPNGLDLTLGVRTEQFLNQSHIW